MSLKLPEFDEHISSIYNKLNMIICTTTIITRDDFATIFGQIDGDEYEVNNIVYHEVEELSLNDQLNLLRYELTLKTNYLRNYPFMLMLDQRVKHYDASLTKSLWLIENPIVISEHPEVRAKQYGIAVALQESLAREYLNCGQQTKYKEFMDNLMQSFNTPDEMLTKNRKLLSNYLTDNIINHIMVISLEQDITGVTITMRTADGHIEIKNIEHKYWSISKITQL